MNWISVEDRLPDEVGEYLTYTPGHHGIRTMGWRTPELNDELQWWSNDYSSTATVTHWQPLPEPPESK